MSNDASRLHSILSARVHYVADSLKWNQETDVALATVQAVLIKLQNATEEFKRGLRLTPPRHPSRAGGNPSVLVLNVIRWTRMEIV